MALWTVATLITQQTKAAIYEAALAIAEALDVPVTSWQPGDPTRSNYWYLAEILANLEGNVVQYARARFLDLVGDQWIGITAKEQYDVDQVEATFASTTIVLTNTGGGFYPIEDGALTVKSTTTGKTYHNINPAGPTPELLPGPGTTLSLTVVADEAGSASSAAPGEIDDFVTTLDASVTVANPTAAIGLDLEEKAAVVARCRAKLGSLSPNGPADAFDYVATTPELSGTTNVTRSRTFHDEDTGDVTIFVAGPSGAVAGGDVTLVEAAEVRYAAPLCITPHVFSAVNKVIAPTYELWIYQSVGVETAAIEAAVQTALIAMLRTRPIGGDVIDPDPGIVAHELIESTIRSAFPDHTFKVLVTVPAADTTLVSSEVAVLGTPTATITFVPDP